MLLTALSAALLLAPAPAADSLACITMNTTNLPVATRQSRLDSVTFAVGGATVKVCYGRPSARGRTMIGGSAVPFGSLWRTGANEPTMIHTTGPISVGGVAVPAGIYSLYTIPGQTEWHVILNRSITQWGHEGRYTEEVKSKEVGHGIVKSSAITGPVETLTFHTEPGTNGAVNLLLDWEKTRVTIPVVAGK